MAQVSFGAYDADVWIPQFRGLNQADVLMNPDMRYAAEAENVETINGVLQPMAECPIAIGEFADRVETFTTFHRRWYTGSGSHDWYVCCSGGKFYQRQAGTSVPWAEIPLPSTVSGAFQNSLWSWVTYEINPVGSTDTIDVLLLSNAQDGMIMIIPPDRPTTWGDLTEFTWDYVQDMTWLETSSPEWHINTIETAGKKMGVIERYGERIWGGDIAGEPDMLMYSAPYDPTDWTANTEIPEDGAGDILQPSWDGDKFYALKRFGDQLLAFKKNRIWRVVGLSPGEFVFQEQFGGGTEFFGTIAVDNDRVLMLTKDGMSIYDGMNTTPFQRKFVEQLWKRTNADALDQSCGCLFKNRYYLSFPIDGSGTNNALLIYDFIEGTVLYHSGLNIEAMLPTDDELFATTSDLPGRIVQIGYDSWSAGAACGRPARWVSPWIDFGRKEIRKGGFDLYFLPEVQDMAVEFSISIQTEKKRKTKLYTVRPIMESQRANYKEHKQKRLHFGGGGRKFRVIIETAQGITAPWRIIGGIQLTVETDPD